jgi:hypothetical protein
MTRWQTIKYTLCDKWFNLIFIDLDCLAHNLEKTDPTRVQTAKSDAQGSNKGTFPGLKSTESNYKWVLLYDHARELQIRPGVMRRMRRSDLEYLAGMAFAHPDLVEPRKRNESTANTRLRHEQATKVLGNATRAQNELKLRNLLWAAFFAGTTALVGVLLTKLLDVSE